MLRKITNRKFFTIALIALAGGLLALILPSVIVWASTTSRSSKELSKLPTNDVALVLGTTPKVGNRANNYFTYRIDAAEKLYKAGKVKYLLLSGANPSLYYNEPQKMKEALVSRGIPTEKIILDYAGLRTLDSVIRAKEIFGANNVTIVSQAFHNHRALYIANHIGLDANAYNAQDVSLQYSLRIKAREILARIRVMLDLYITNTQPKFLGEKQILPLDAPSSSLE